MNATEIIGYTGKLTGVDEMAATLAFHSLIPGDKMHVALSREGGSFIDTYDATCEERYPIFITRR